jgi:hypothetical protein
MQSALDSQGGKERSFTIWFKGKPSEKEPCGNATPGRVRSQTIKDYCL